MEASSCDSCSSDACCPESAQPTGLVGKPIRSALRKSDNRSATDWLMTARYGHWAPAVGTELGRVVIWPVPVLGDRRRHRLARRICTVDQHRMETTTRDAIRDPAVGCRRHVHRRIHGVAKLPYVAGGLTPDRRRGPIRTSLRSRHWRYDWRTISANASHDGSPSPFKPAHGQRPSASAVVRPRSAAAEPALRHPKSLQSVFLFSFGNPKTHTESARPVPSLKFVAADQSSSRQQLMDCGPGGRPQCGH